MKREIKFLAWDSKKLVRPDYIDREGIAHWQENSIPETSSDVIQFIGLTDKNGKEIYEGYIVIFHKGYADDSWTDTEQGLPYVIEWDKQTCKFFAKRNNNYLTPCSNMESRKYPWAWKVIGNIYENPELLNK